MLYDLHELQRAFLNPLSRFTDSGSLLFSHPYSPLAYTPVSRHLAATYELVHRLGKDYEKPLWNLDETTVDNETVGVTVNTVVQKPFCNLIHFKRALDRKSTRLNSSHVKNSYAVFCLKKKMQTSGRRE